MSEITTETVRAHFDAEARGGRRLLPDPNTLSGLGTYTKYRTAASLIASPTVTNVLDLGCNRGSIEALFQSLYPGKSGNTLIEGIDISGEAIRQANALRLPNCRFQTYDGSKLPYPSDCFDLVLMVEVIEHVAEKEQMLREVWRVLRPSGRLFLTTPNPECWPLKIELTMWEILRDLFRRRQPFKDAFISHENLAGLLASVGFHTVQAIDMYAWPRLFITFLSWGIIPPLPPKALLGYQKLCLKVLDRHDLPGFLNKRLKWSLVALLTKNEFHQDVVSSS